MDSAHDLGGKQGHGHVAVDGDGPAFRHDWEARMWAINCALADTKSGSLDWWRHCRELIAATDYLNRPYFDSWMQTYSAYLIDQGMISVAELSGARAEFHHDRAVSAATPDRVADMAAHIARFDEEGAAPGQFIVGQHVCCRLNGAPGHTRLPGYVRGRAGVISALRGRHIFPDSGARGKMEYVPLYTVRFSANELWPEVNGSTDGVYLDLWEPYLMSADPE